MLTYPLIKY